jgi:hypothetical protein
MQGELFNNQDNPDYRIRFPLIPRDISAMGGWKRKTVGDGGKAGGRGQPPGQPGHAGRRGKIGNRRNVTKLAGPDEIRQWS